MKEEKKSIKDIIEVYLEGHNKHVQEGDHYFDCDCSDEMAKEITKLLTDSVVTTCHGCGKVVHMFPDDVTNLIRA